MHNTNICKSFYIFRSFFKITFVFFGITSALFLDKESSAKQAIDIYSKGSNMRYVLVDDLVLKDNEDRNFAADYKKLISIVQSDLQYYNDQILIIKSNGLGSGVEYLLRSEEKDKLKMMGVDCILRISPKDSNIDSNDLSGGIKNNFFNFNLKLTSLKEDGESVVKNYVGPASSIENVGHEISLLVLQNVLNKKYSPISSKMILIRKFDNKKNSIANKIGIKKDEISGLYMADWDGKNPKLLVPGEYISSPSFCGAKNILAYTSFGDGIPGIEVLNLNTGKIFNLKQKFKNLGVANIMSPIFKHDCSAIFFTALRSNKYGIYKLNLDSGRINKIISNNIDIPCGISDDGFKLLMTSNMTGRPNIYVYDIQKKIMREMEGCLGFCADPSWNEDQESLAFVNIRKGIFSVIYREFDLENGSVYNNVLFSGYWAATPFVHKDKDFIIFSYKNRMSDRSKVMMVKKTQGSKSGKSSNRQYIKKQLIDGIDAIWIH